MRFPFGSGAVWAFGPPFGKASSRNPAQFSRVRDLPHTNLARSEILRSARKTAPLRMTPRNESSKLKLHHHLPFLLSRELCRCVLPSPFAFKCEFSLLVTYSGVRDG